MHLQPAGFDSRGNLVIRARGFWLGVMAAATAALVAFVWVIRPEPDLTGFGCTSCDARNGQIIKRRAAMATLKAAKAPLKAP